MKRVLGVALALSFLCASTLSVQAEEAKQPAKTKKAPKGEEPKGDAKADAKGDAKPEAKGDAKGAAKGEDKGKPAEAKPADKPAPEKKKGW